jgi:hypothetical protein
MRNKRTKITFLLLACAVIISLFNGNKVSADSKIDNGFEYTVEDNKITITNYIGSETNLVIPSHIDNLPVVCIGEAAFANKIPVTPITPTATPTSSSILLDGKSVKLECYTIDGFNYFKLRDIAMILQDTPNKFDVKWEPVNKAIQLLIGVDYTVTGGELTFSNVSGKIITTVTTSPIFIGDQETQLSAFAINGYNYFKLRDIGEALYFGVGYDVSNNTIMIGTGWRPTQDSTYKTYQYRDSQISVEIRYASGMPISGNLYASIDGGEWHQIGNENYLYGYTGTINGMNQSLVSDRYIDFKDGWIYVQAINHKDGGVNGIHKVNIETGETIKVD